MVSAGSSLNHAEGTGTASEARNRAPKIFVRSERHTVDPEQVVPGSESEGLGCGTRIDVGYLEGTMCIGDLQIQPKHSIRNAPDHRLRQFFGRRRDLAKLAVPIELESQILVGRHAFEHLEELLGVLSRTPLQD